MLLAPCTADSQLDVQASPDFMSPCRDSLQSTPDLNRLLLCGKCAVFAVDAPKLKEHDFASFRFFT